MAAAQRRYKMAFSSKQKKLSRLRDMVLDRYQREGKAISPDLANAIYYDLLGTCDRYGWAETVKRAETAELL